MINEAVNLSASKNIQILQNYKQHEVNKMTVCNTLVKQNQKTSSLLTTATFLLKCFWSYSKLCTNRVLNQTCSHCLPTYERAAESVDKDLQGFSRDIRMCSRWAMWACVTELQQYLGCDYITGHNLSAAFTDFPLYPRFASSITHTEHHHSVTGKHTHRNTKHLLKWISGTWLQEELHSVLLYSFKPVDERFCDEELTETWSFNSMIKKKTCDAPSQKKRHNNNNT